MISLEAYRNGVMVDSMSVEIRGNGLINHWNLSVSGTLFDTLRVNGSGPNDRGIFIGLVDNMVVLPEPGTFTLLGIGLAGMALYRGRRKKVAAAQCSI
jgi:hypothetical protein